MKIKAACKTGREAEAGRGREQHWLCPVSKPTYTEDAAKWVGGAPCLIGKWGELGKEDVAAGRQGWDAAVLVPHERRAAVRRGAVDVAKRAGAF